MDDEADKIYSEFIFNIKDMGLRSRGRNHIIYDDEGFVYGQIPTHDRMNTTDNRVIYLELVDASTLKFNAMTRSIVFQYGEAMISLKGVPDTEKEVTEMSMPKTPSEIYALLPRLGKRFKNAMYEDVLTERLMFDRKIIGEPKGGVSDVMADGNMMFIHHAMEQAFRDRGYTKGIVSRSAMTDAVIMACMKNRQNSFNQWMRGLSWDGTPRLRRWFIDIFGAHAPNLLFGDENGEQYVEEVTQAWFMGVVGRSFEETPQTIIPVLMGVDVLGRGNALRYTAGKDKFYKEYMGSIESPVAMSEDLKGAVIADIGLDMIDKGKASALRNLLTESSVAYKKRYLDNVQENPKTYSLIVTTPDKEVFCDASGSGCFFPLKCYYGFYPNKRMIPLNRMSEVPQNEVEQLWAEAYDMYVTRGLRQALPDTEEFWNLVREARQMVTYTPTGFISISDWLSDPLNGYSEVGSVVDKKVIFEEMFGLDIRSYPELLNDEKVGKIWRAWRTECGESWEYNPVSARVPDKITGKTRVACPTYRRVLPPIDEPLHIREERLMVEKTREVYQAAESVDWRDRFDALQDVYKFVKKGDAFPAFDLSIDEVEFLLRQGWVREGPNGIEFVCMPEPNVDLKSRVYREKEAKHDAIRRSVL